MSFNLWKLLPQSFSHPFAACNPLSITWSDPVQRSLLCCISSILISNIVFNFSPFSYCLSNLAKMSILVILKGLVFGLIDHLLCLCSLQLVSVLLFPFLFFLWSYFLLLLLFILTLCAMLSFLIIFLFSNICIYIIPFPILQLIL